MKRKALSLFLALALCMGLAAPAMAAGTVKILPTADLGSNEGGGWTVVEVDGWELTNFVSEDYFYFSDFEKENDIKNPIYYADSPATLTSLFGLMRPDSYYVDGVYRFSGSLTDDKTLPGNILNSGLLTHVEPVTLGERQISGATNSDGTPVEYSYPTGSTYVLEDGVYLVLCEMMAGISLIVVGNGWETPGTVPVPEAPSDWAAEQVTAAIGAGLVPEALRGKYTQAATRAEFCALSVALYEIVTGAEVAGRVSFNDTADINVEKAAYIGVVNGVGEGNFAPGTGLTREQAATMLSRLADAVGKPLTAQAPTFNDNADISSWALDAVGQTQATGIMGGVGDNTFSPAADYTREQSIVTILRLFDIVK